VSLFRRARTARFTSAFTGGLFVMYGLYQIVSGIFQLTLNQTTVITAGTIYIVIGFLAVWLGRKAYRTARRE
jgi:uncharacterized membrane protein